MATFDYRVYDEIKQMKKEIREQRAMRNLAELLAADNNEEAKENREEPRNKEDDEDEFSMSLSYNDYYKNNDGYRDFYDEDDHYNAA